MLNQLADRADARDETTRESESDSVASQSTAGATNTSADVVAPPPVPPPVKRTDYAPSPPDPSLN
jgi:hypothetical protein